MPSMVRDEAISTIRSWASRLSMPRSKNHQRLLTIPFYYHETTKSVKLHLETGSQNSVDMSTHLGDEAATCTATAKP